MPLWLSLVLWCAPRGSLDKIGSPGGDGAAEDGGDTWLGWGSVTPQKPQYTAQPFSRLAPSLQAICSMIAILAMPQMKTRVAATIYKSSGECGAHSHISLCESASVERENRKRESMRKGKGEHKIFGEREWRVQSGRGAHSAQRVLQPSDE